MEKIESIEKLRFPLAVFVVMEHTLSKYMQTDDGQSFPYLIFDVFLRDNSVPVFFFISGLLFFHNTTNFNHDTWKKKLQRRLHTLFIPYIIWNIFAIILLWLTLHTGMGHYTANSKIFSPSIGNFLKCFWMYDGMLADSFNPSSYPINVALWYVRNLIILCLIAKPIHFAIKRNIPVTFTLCAAIWVFIHDSSLFFFTAGAYFSISKHNTTNLNRNNILYTSLCAYILSGVALLLIPYQESVSYIIKQINIIAFIPLVFSIANNIKEITQLHFLSSASCLIYFAHQPICGKINKLIIVTMHPESQKLEFVINMLAVIITIVLLSVLYRIMAKYSHKILYILTGK